MPTPPARPYSRVMIVLAATAALLTGCVPGGDCPVGASGAAASCAAGVVFRDRLYVAWSPKLPVRQGRLLSRGAAYPPCNDTGCADADPGPAETTRIWAVRGIDPRDVVVARQQGTGRLVVHGALDADPRDYFRFDGRRWHLRTGR